MYREKIINKILNNSEIDIPIFKALFCNFVSPNVRVIDAKATALSADNTNSSDIITGSRGANSTHLSMPSSKGVREVKAAESIEFYNLLK